MAWLDKKNVSYFLCILRLVRIHESTKIFQTSFDFSPILLHLVLDTVWVYSSEKTVQYTDRQIAPFETNEPNCKNELQTQNWQARCLVVSSGVLLFL